MTNPDRCEIDLEINGRVYTLKGGANVWCALEEHCSTPGRRVGSTEIWALADHSFTYFRAAIWHMLKPHHPEITLEQAGDLIDAAGGPKAFQAVYPIVLKHLIPDPKDLAKLGVTSGARPPKAQAVNGSGRRRGTGTRSVATPAGSG